MLQYSSKLQQGAFMQKNLRFDDDMLKKFNELKERHGIKSDIDLVKKMIDNLYYETEKIELEKYKDLERENKSLLLRVGELQGELNVFKQLALPQKSSKKWWQFWKNNNK